ncbi:MAG: condensation domain-containing protein, partial [Pseudomonas sp.]
MTVADRLLVLAQRFAELDPAARRQLGEKLKAQGLSVESLPIPARKPGQQQVVASYAQRRLWTLWQLDRQCAAYNQAGALRLEGSLDVIALQTAVDALVARHEVLRTRFIEADGELLQEVLAPSTQALKTIDLSTVTEPEAELDSLVQATAVQVFDLHQGPLLQIQHVRLGEQRHALLLALHHIISDGWSMQILLAELAE